MENSMLPSTTWTPPSSIPRQPRTGAGVRVVGENRFIWFAEVERAGCPISIGRDPSCDIHLPHASVSRVHCRIRRSTGGEMMIEDCGSRYGVKLYTLGPNDTPRMVEWAAVVLGSEIKLGAVVLSFVDGIRSIEHDDTAIFDARRAFELPRPGISSVSQMTTMRRRRAGGSR